MLNVFQYLGSRVNTYVGAERTRFDALLKWSNDSGLNVLDIEPKSNNEFCLLYDEDSKEWVPFVKKLWTSDSSLDTTTSEELFIGKKKGHKWDSKPMPVEVTNNKGVYKILVPSSPVRRYYAVYEGEVRPTQESDRRPVLNLYKEARKEFERVGIIPKKYFPIIVTAATVFVLGGGCTAMIRNFQGREAELIEKNNALQEQEAELIEKNNALQEQLNKINKLRQK